ncbi:MAG: leucyl/phenylalanyl-tRNA--protein transferase [Candidatus Rariloculaceae bacterium]
MFPIDETYDHERLIFHWSKPELSGPRWLTDNDERNAFPPLDEALTEPNGLLASGGDLSPQRLLTAYVSGIFPWYELDQPILWWSPDPRTVLWPDNLHISRRLQRTRRRSELTFSCDKAFSSVIESCARPRNHSSGTWITTDMRIAYETLHELGWAHSFEAWHDNALVGGLYGIGIGQVFFGESMFSSISNASKIALITAIEFLKDAGFELLDCQIWSNHLQTLGATTLPRNEFLQQLNNLCDPAGSPHSWTQDFQVFSDRRGSVS